MDSRQSESVLVTLPQSYYASLYNEVKRIGITSAVSNRTTFATRSRLRGDIPAAEDAEKDAEIMQMIAKKNGFQ